MKYKIFIIIATFNGMRWLPKCLKSTKPYSVIVVDNYSVDGTVEFIKKNYPEIKLFEKKENLGFGRANNIGISYALQEGADYVFLLNQDAYLTKNCLGVLVDLQIKNVDFGILSPIHLNGEHDRLDRNFSFQLNYDANPNFYSDFILKNKLSEVYEVPFVNAAGWLLSRECINTVGGFDPIFFHYGEDDNYCQRMIYHGFKIGVVPSVFLCHDRENRINRDTAKKKQERLLRIEYANINVKNQKKMRNSLKKTRWYMIKSFLKLNFIQSRWYHKEYRLLKTSSKEIERSRLQNIIKGPNYLT